MDMQDSEQVESAVNHLLNQTPKVLSIEYKCGLNCILYTADRQTTIT